jgi:hypothetical protein
VLLAHLGANFYMFGALGWAIAVAFDFSPAVRSGARWPWQPFAFDIGGA